MAVARGSINHPLIYDIWNLLRSFFPFGKTCKRSKSKDKDQNQEILGKFEQFTHSLECLIKLIFATPFFLTIFAVFAFILGSIFMFLLDFAFPQAFEDVWLELTFMFGLSFLAIIGIAVYSGKNSTPPNDTNDKNDG